MIRQQNKKGSHLCGIVVMAVVTCVLCDSDDSLFSIDK